jgi:iron complex transport system substrate-binding protein
MVYKPARASKTEPSAAGGRGWPGRCAAVALALILLGCGRQPSAAPSATAPEAARPSARIVSLAPSITETLYALDLGSRVVGVTSYCDYPPEAATKPKVGALLDPNVEAVLALRPDLVILFASHGAALSALAVLEIPCLTVSGDTMEQILTSIQTIATACACPERGAALTTSLRRRIDAVASRPRPVVLPRVLVSVGRSMGSGRLQDVYVAGEDGFFSELIRLAGGRNACPEQTIRFPMVSPEGIQEMNPDVIIELAADLDRLGLTAADVVREWSAVSEVPAVRRGQVHVFTEDYVTVPGPRFVLLLEQMAAAIAAAPPAAGGGTPGGGP